MKSRPTFFSLLCSILILFAGANAAEASFDDYGIQAHSDSSHSGSSQNAKVENAAGAKEPDYSLAAVIGLSIVGLAVGFGIGYHFGNKSAGVEYEHPDHARNFGWLGGQGGG